MSILGSIFAALKSKYDESKPVLDDELLVYATEKQKKSLAKWDAMGRAGNKMAESLAFALRAKLAKAMSDAQTAEDEPRRPMRAKKARR